jgi:hypothetical protein
MIPAETPLAAFLYAGTLTMRFPLHDKDDIDAIILRAQ